MKENRRILVVGKCMISWSQTQWRCFASTILKKFSHGLKESFMQFETIQLLQLNADVMFLLIHLGWWTQIYCNFKTSASMGLGKLKKIIPSSFHQNGWKPKKTHIRWTGSFSKLKKLFTVLWHILMLQITV